VADAAASRPPRRIGKHRGERRIDEPTPSQIGQLLVDMQSELAPLDCGPDVGTDGTARIGATVTNTSDRDGAVVVQLYVRVNTIGVTRPAQQLAGFVRVELGVGERSRVTFELHASQLACTNLTREVAVEPARVDVFVGLDAHDRSLVGSFEVLGTPRVVSGAERSYLSTASVGSATVGGHAG
jgi:Fibronectin type III-like domain